jgi:hypothetical protein
VGHLRTKISIFVHLSRFKLRGKNCGLFPLGCRKQHVTLQFERSSDHITEVEQHPLLLLAMSKECRGYLSV